MKQLLVAGTGIGFVSIEREKCIAEISGNSQFPYEIFPDYKIVAIRAINIVLLRYKLVAVLTIQVSKRSI